MLAVEAMVGKIGAVQSLRAGPSITDRHRGWTHGLVVRLDVTTAAELKDQYSDHPGEFGGRVAMT